MRSLSLPSLKRFVAKRETKVERLQADVAEEVCVSPARQPSASLAKESSQASSPRSPPATPGSSEVSTAASSTERDLVVPLPAAPGRRVRALRPGLRRTPTAELLDCDEDGYPQLREESATTPPATGSSGAAPPSTLAASRSTPRLPSTEATQRSTHDLRGAELWAVPVGRGEDREHTFLLSYDKERRAKQRRPARKVFSAEKEMTLYNKSPATVRELYNRGLAAQQAAKMVARARAREVAVEVAVDLESLPAIVKRTTVCEREA